MASSLLFYVLIMFVDPGEVDSEKEKNKMANLKITRPEIFMPQNLCYACHIPKIARSQHCSFCGKCVCKWEKHCFIVNRCIGAGNVLIYCVFRWLYTFTLFLVLCIFFMEKKEDNDRRITPSSFATFLLAFLLFLNNLKESLMVFFGLIYNLTQQELYNCKKYTYLWKSKKGGFFNSFDKVTFLRGNFT